MEFNTAKFERYVPIKFYVLLIKIGTFEVTSQYFDYFISISPLVFENDKWTFGGLLWAFQYVSPP